MEKHTYAFSDLHGIYNLWVQIRDFAQPQDTLIFLGDAIDRGPDGIKIIQEMLDDQRVIFIKGNHEDMMINAWENPFDLPLWKANGANKTRKDLMRIPHSARVELINKLKYQMRNSYIYHNTKGQRIFLTHSGFTPFNKESEDIIWNREHITDEWNKNKDLEDIVIVHGHTIVWTLDEYDKKLNLEMKVSAIKYCENHKIDIDMGSAFTGKVCLLDLDILEPIYFTIDNFNKIEYNIYINKKKRKENE